jgi:hypothetical protein
MSAIIKFVAPADLLFQPVESEPAFAKSEFKAIRLEPTRALQERFWQLPGQAVSSRAAMVEIIALVLFAGVALLGVISCFAELSHLLGSNAIAQVAARVISAGS